MLIQRAALLDGRVVDIRVGAQITEMAPRLTPNPDDRVLDAAQGPGPRVGHAALLVGNAFIVFGGDTKMDDSDVLDDTLYLLNTCKWPDCIPKATLTRNSLQTVVEGHTPWATATWPIWPHAQHPWL